MPPTYLSQFIVGITIFQNEISWSPVSKGVDHDFVGRIIDLCTNFRKCRMMVLFDGRMFQEKV